ncbi:MAG: CPBP family intramembrane glutamic endopeptidase [Cytophagaceae bacterium]
MKNFRNIIIILTGLLIAYSPKVISKTLSLLNISFGLEGFHSVFLWNWLATILLIVFIIGIEGKKLNSILLYRLTIKDLQWSLLLAGIALAWSWAIHLLFPPFQSEGLSEIVAQPLGLVLALIITAAITEEILYRAYPIERIHELTGKRWLAVGLSFTIFILPHIQFFGPLWLIYHGGGTVIIYLLYLWRRNLYACMLLHFFINAPILIPVLSR